MVTDNVIDPSVLLGERNAKIALQHIAQEYEILFCFGFIQAIFFFKVRADFRRHCLVVHQWVARNLVHGEEGRGCDKPDSNDACNEPLDGVGKHV